MGKKSWPKTATKRYVSETHTLIAHLKAFKERWRQYANRHDKPKDPDMGQITDAEMDLQDCLLDSMVE
jgi:hypothetical protein